MFIKEIHYYRTQSITEAHVVFDGEFTRFFGNNSNGKSIYTKIIMCTLNGKLTRPKTRKSLVQRKSNSCQLVVVRSDALQLTINIDIESSKTYVQLGPQKRYLSDKNTLQLMREFGYHYDEELGISLNVCDETGVSLFFSNTPKQTYKLVSLALSDMTAEVYHRELLRVYEEAQGIKRKATPVIKANKLAMENIIVYDLDAEKAKRAKLAYCFKNLRRLNFSNFPIVREVPNVITLDLHSMPVLNYPPLLSLPTTLMPDLKKVAMELEHLRKGVCPTCQRDFSTFQTSTNEIQVSLL